MIGVVFAFLGGGLFGMIGMATLACYAKKDLMLCNRILRNRMEWLQEENQKSYQPVKDPRPQVHALAN